MNNGTIGTALRELYSLLPLQLRSKVGRLRVVEFAKNSIDAFEAPRQVHTADGAAWFKLADCPAALLDPGGVQIGNLLYVICGFESISKVSNKMHVFDMSRKKWGKSIAVPDDLPHSHSTVSTDGTRYIYIAGGQLGANCSPAVPWVYCFDTKASTWHRLPPLPAPRYAGTMQLWRGRLHYAGGADVDRWTPVTDHWSLGVSGTAATDTTWRRDVPVPIGGMHRGTALVADQFYLFGGQQGDYKAIEGDPHYTCTEKTQETYLQSAFRLTHPGGNWERLADLPIAVSHCDFSSLVSGRMVYLYGGQIFKHPQSYSIRLTDAIQAYDTQTDRWSIAGYLPYHLKTPVLGQCDKQVFMTVGQRGNEDTDGPGPLSAQTWQTPVQLPAQAPVPEARTRRESAQLASLNGKKVLLVSHDLTRSGAPLELLELGKAMIDSGAIVRAATLADDAMSGNLCAQFKIPLIPQETALAQAIHADLIVLNTTHDRVRDWAEACLKQSPDVANRMIWMVHEIDVESFKETAGVLARVKYAAFDSSACLKAWSEICALPGECHVVHPGLQSETFNRGTQKKHLFHGATRLQRSRTPRPLSRKKIRSELGVQDDEFLLISVGTFTIEKGQELLLKSVARAAHERQLALKLIFVGFENEEVQQQILQSLDGIGQAVLSPKRCYLVTPHIDALFLASDAHVLNSQGQRGRGETFGRSTVHAMAHGLPVFGTREGGTAEIIEDNISGFLYPVGEAGQAIMIDRIETLVRDRDLGKSMGELGRIRAMTYFQKDRYLQQMDAIFASLLSKT